jgi:hypothetical protein
VSLTAAEQELYKETYTKVHEKWASFHSAGAAAVNKYQVGEGARVDKGQVGEVQEGPVCEREQTLAPRTLALSAAGID